MTDSFKLVKPNFVPPLDEAFRPAVLANRAFQRELEAAGGGVPLVIGLERASGAVSRFETRVFPAAHPRAAANLMYAERLFKFLMWQRGGYKAYVGGPHAIGDYIQRCYAPHGQRAFDFHFMGEDVYEKPFTVVACDAADVSFVTPALPHKELEQAFGVHQIRSNPRMGGGENPHLKA